MSCGGGGLGSSFRCRGFEGAYSAVFFDFQAMGEGFAADDCGDFVDESPGVLGIC